MPRKQTSSVFAAVQRAAMRRWTAQVAAAARCGTVDRAPNDDACAQIAKSSVSMKKEDGLRPCLPTTAVLRLSVRDVTVSCPCTTGHGVPCTHCPGAAPTSPWAGRAGRRRWHRWLAQAAPMSDARGPRGSNGRFCFATFQTRYDFGVGGFGRIQPGLGPV